MGRSKELVVCELFDVARWIGLRDASLLGTQPIMLPTKAVAKLEQFGGRAELLPGEVASILKVTTNTVKAYTVETRECRLGHRVDTSNRMWVPAADLVVFIEARSKPPVPTTGKVPQVDQAAARRSIESLKRNHGLHAA